MPRRCKCQSLLLRFTPIHPGLIVICLRSDVKSEKGDGCDAPSMLLFGGGGSKDNCRNHQLLFCNEDAYI